MERESFEDEDTAVLMNEYFISVKVDREERPDVDQIYQSAVQAMGVHGGWPLTVFLTPEGSAFYGGTYYPPMPSFGRPGFAQVLQAIADAWENRRDELISHGERIQQALDASKDPPSALVLSPENVAEAVQTMVQRIDRHYGGLGRAPKFPSATSLLLMMRHGRSAANTEAVDLALFTLRQMARGGICDQLGGGFHRYSTDNRWLVPHFEKMLYDNAQLLEAYTLAWQITRESEFAEIAKAIRRYIQQEMTSPEGGFYATQDADSEGVEGKFFVWDYEEVRKLLPTEAMFRLAEEAYGLSPEGNFEGYNILYQAKPLIQIAKELVMPVDTARKVLEEARVLLFAAREERAKPIRDEKIITGWNGLTISGLCRMGQALHDKEAVNLSQNAARFILNTLRRDETHLYRIYKDGQSKIPAFLDDYAFFVQGLLDLYETDFDPMWLTKALLFTETILEEFPAQDGRYALNSRIGERLSTTPYSGFDQAIPSGVSIHCQNMLRLKSLTGDDKYDQEVRSILAAYIDEMSAYPLGYAGLLTALEMQQRGLTEIAFIGENYPLLAKIRETFIPYRVIAAWNGKTPPPPDHPAAPFLAKKPHEMEETAVYVCSGCVCHPPQKDWAALKELLETQP